MQSEIQYNNGKLDYIASTKPDTVFLQGKDSIIYRPQIVEKEVYRLTWWQELWIKLGKGLSCLIILLISPKLWKYCKMIIKLF